MHAHRITPHAYEVYVFLARRRMPPPPICPNRGGAVDFEFSIKVHILKVVKWDLERVFIDSLSRARECVETETSIGIYRRQRRAEETEANTNTHTYIYMYISILC